MKRFLFASGPAAAVIVVLVVSGCTPGYLVMESIAAGSDHDLDPGRIGDIADAGVRDITVITDSTLVSGTFAGLRIADTSDTRLLWEEWAKASGLDLRPGDSIAVRRSELMRGTVWGRFAGISEDEMIIQEGPEEFSVPVASIATVKRHGRVWTGVELRRILRQHAPPSARVLVVATVGGDSVSIPLHAVVGGIYSRAFSFKGLLLTVPLDLLWAAIIVEDVRDGMFGHLGR